MIRTLPILMGAVMLSLNSFAQINEKFENGLESLSANCWQFDNVKYTKKRRQSGLCNERSWKYLFQPTREQHELQNAGHAFFGCTRCAYQL